jgi:HD-GYP domain-containing protein (c-di-GMP phosphodiesterase class II)
VVTLAVVGNRLLEERRVRRPLGTRADETHLASDHVDQLGQLVERGAPEEHADPVPTAIVDPAGCAACLEDLDVLQIVVPTRAPHRPKLDHLETAPTTTDTRLTKQHGTTECSRDRDGRPEQQRQQGREREDGKNTIEAVFQPQGRDSRGDRSAAGTLALRLDNDCLHSSHAEYLVYPASWANLSRTVAAVLPSSEPPIRAAEVVGALSLATDLGTGQPLEHALRTAVLAVRLGELAGASAQELVDTYYVALLHASGCTSNGHEATQVFGEDIEHRAAFFLIDPANPAEVLAFYNAYVGAGRPPEVRTTMIEAVIADAGVRAREGFAAMCEVAQRFAGWLDLGSSIQASLEYVFARWDGRGFPDARGDAIPLPMRLLHVARDISLFLSASGPDEARAVIERRTGAAYEPRLAELAVRNFGDLLSGLDETRMWEQAMEIEPFPQIRIAGARVDAAFMAIATLTGLKSPWLREHSTGVAELAEAAAWRMGLPAPSVALVRRAALAHDLGRVGVSNAIWEKPGPLGFGEWERVRLHPHFSERAFAQSAVLAPIGILAGSHHERLDGSGYHRGTRGPALDQAARILAAADCYAAMREARPYRAALDAPAAETELMREVEDGRLDADAVDAVLAAAGHRVRQRPRELPAGLTERELEVLLVLVRGGSNQQIADDLGISAKTVGSHVEHVYQKAGVRSRAAATVWAFEQDLVRAG